jgi:hypothetical protein
MSKGWRQKKEENKNGRSSQKTNPSMTQQDQHGLAMSKNSLCSNRVGVGSNSTKIRLDRKGSLASCRILLLHREEGASCLWLRKLNGSRLPYYVVCATGRGPATVEQNWRICSVNYFVTATLLLVSQFEVCAFLSKGVV